MQLSEYASYDALGLAKLIAGGGVSPREAAETAMGAIEAANPTVNAVVETYPDRTEGLDEEGRLIEFGSRLCQGMVCPVTTNVGKLLNASGLNILGRSNIPEYLMSCATENALYGATSNPWREGYCAGGSSGGGAAASLKVGVAMKPFMGVPVEPEVAAAVQATAKVLADMGHEIVESDPEFDGMSAVRKFCDIWFFGFDGRLEGYSKATGHPITPDHLEPVIWAVYEHARRMKPADFIAAMAEANRARRALARVYEACDVWLGPTLTRPAEPHGNYHLGRADVATMEDYVEKVLAVPAQFTVPHNILGTPTLTLPLAMHSAGLPIGIQLGAPHAQEHVRLQLGAALEQAMPWAGRVPPLHVSR